MENKIQTNKFNNFKTKWLINFKAALSLSKLLNASYWQSIFGPVFSFIFPIFFIGIYVLIMNVQALADEKTYELVIKSAIVGVVALQLMSFAINSIPTAINDYKNSVLLKRIGSTPIKPVTFLLTAGLYYGCLMIIQFFWCLFIVLIWLLIGGINLSIVFGAGTQGNNPIISWPGFIFAIFYTIIISIFIALFVVSITKSPVASNAIGMIIFFLSMFLSGMLFPIQNIVGDSFLNILSYFTPFRYTTGLITMSWNGANIFSITGDYKIGLIVVYHDYDQWLNFFVPVCFVGASIYVSAKNFKWNVR